MDKATILPPPPPRLPEPPFPAGEVTAEICDWDSLMKSVEPDFCFGRVDYIEHLLRRYNPSKLSGFQSYVRRGRDNNCTSLIGLVRLIIDEDIISGYISAHYTCTGSWETDRARAEEEVCADAWALIDEYCAFRNISREELNERLQTRTVWASAVISAAYKNRCMNQAKASQGLKQKEVVEGEVLILKPESPPHHDKLLAFVLQHPPESLDPEYVTRYLQSPRIGRPSKKDKNALAWLKENAQYMIPTDLSGAPQICNFLRQEYAIVVSTDTVYDFVGIDI